MREVGGDRERDPVSVVVLAAGQRHALADCLEGVARQRSAPETVVAVVDSAPSDGAADLALRHPAVHWVALANRQGLAELCQRGIECARSPQVAIINAQYRPGDRWLERGLCLLAHGAQVVIGIDPSRSVGDRLTSLFLESHVPARIPFCELADVDSDVIEEFAHRCRAAGLEVLFDEQPGVGPIPRDEASMVEIRAKLQLADRPLPGIAPRSVARPKPSSAPMNGLISVVLCTSGKRPDMLELCLKSFSGLDDPNFEVVVVENSRSASLSIAQLEAIGARHIHEPLLGLDRARNRGVRETRGEIVAFIDDDCEADPGWLRGIRDAFADPMVSFATGRVRPAQLDQASHQWFESRFPFDRGPYSQRFTRFDGGGISPLQMGVLGTGANMAFRRDLLDRIGEFDIALDMGTLVGGGGDLDMFARALADGEVCQYVADGVVFHHHRDTMTKLRWQTWGYGLSQGAMCAKHLLNVRSRRMHPVMRYLRMLRDHRRRLTAVKQGKDRYPSELVLLELTGIALGPVAYLMSLARQKRPRVR